MSGYFYTEPTPKNDKTDEIMTPDFVDGVIKSKIESLNNAAAKKAELKHTAQEVVEEATRIALEHAEVVPPSPIQYTPEQ